MYNELVVMTGNANRDMARMIAENLNVPILDVEVGRFSDGEIQVKIKENFIKAGKFIGIQVKRNPVPSF